MKNLIPATVAEQQKQEPPELGRVTPAFLRDYWRTVVVFAFTV
jgi:hypothetical protein